MPTSDPVEILLRHDLWATTQILHACEKLTAEQFAQRRALPPLGQRQAILAAKLLHGLALVALVLFGIGAGLGGAYYVGVAVGAVLIAWEHQLVKPGDLSRLNAAFFGANGVVSVVVFLGALVDRIAS